MTAHVLSGRLALLLLPAVLGLGACSFGSDWLAFRGQEGKGYTTNAVRPPIGIKWKLSLQSDRRGAYAFNNPVLKDGICYFGSTDGNFYALDLETGFMRWVFKTGAAVNSIPCADDTAVYFGSNDGRVYAAGLKDGRRLWEFDTGRTVQSAIIRYKDFVVFSSDGGSTFFLDPAGREVFSLPNPVWYYHTFQIHDDLVYFAPGPPENPVSFGVFDLKTRSYAWVLDAAEFDTHWYSFEALHGESVFFSTGLSNGQGWDLAFYAFDRKTGARRWSEHDRARLPGGLRPNEQFERNIRLLDYMAPAIAPGWFGGGTLVYSVGDTRLRAFDTGSGESRWTRDFPVATSSAAIVAADRVYVGLAAGRPGVSRLACLSARDGRDLWSLEVEGNILSPPVISGKWMIFGTDRNIMYVLEQVL
jgi:outer membrane protein assembly factor BamB